MELDSLYGDFPGADGLAQATSAPPQVNKDGQPYVTLPQPLASAPGSEPTNPAVAENSAIAKPAAIRPPDRRFATNLPNAPFPIFSYVSPLGKTADPGARFYQEQTQIDGGKMDRFVSAGSSGGLPSATTTQLHCRWANSQPNTHWLITSSMPPTAFLCSTTFG